MEITTDMVKELRDRTGISVMQCKAALEEAQGDTAKAILILSKKSGAIAAKKGDRTLGAGAISTYTHANNEIGSMVVMRSETDFVSKNADFVTLARELALQVAASNPEYVKREDVPEEKVAAVRDLFKKDIAGKPENIKETVLQGKVDAYFKNIVLMEQAYIKDPDTTVKDLIDSAIQKFGERVEVEQFARFSVQ